MHQHVWPIVCADVLVTHSSACSLSALTSPAKFEPQDLTSPNCVIQCSRTTPAVKELALMQVAFAMYTALPAAQHTIYIVYQYTPSKHLHAAPHGNCCCPVPQTNLDFTFGVHSRPASQHSHLVQKQLIGTWAVLLKRGWVDETAEARHAIFAELEQTVAASTDAAARRTAIQLLEVGPWSCQCFCPHLPITHICPYLQVPCTQLAVSVYLCSARLDFSNAGCA